MNRGTKNSFLAIQAAAASFQQKTAEILLKYRDERSKAEVESSAYKDSDGMFAAANASLKVNARNAIANAEKAFTGVVTDELQSLRKEFAAHMLAAPSQMFISNLRLYRDFGIKPGRAEINALIEQSGGSTLALQCLDSTLEAVGADFRIDFPDAGTFEDDLASLEKMAFGGFAYTPNEMHGEAVALFGGQEIVFHRPDGSTYTNGTKWDSVRLITARAVFESQIKALNEMGTRWTESVIPSVVTRELYHENENATAEEQFKADKAATVEAVNIEHEPHVSGIGISSGGGKNYNDVMDSYLR